jgi:hypothetical protein
MPKLLGGRQLRDSYRFAGFFPAGTVRGVFGDPKVRILTLHRREKKQPVEFVTGGTAAFTTRSFAWSATLPVVNTISTWSCSCAG